MNAPFLAATASPRRHKILAALGVNFTVFEANGQEIHDESDAVRTVSSNALAKHASCSRLNPSAWILAADTVVEFNGRCLGKPATPDDARRMLIAFSGKSQQIFTAVALSTPSHDPELRIVASSVRFRDYGPETVEAYLNQAQTYDRAGAYDIDTLGEMIIASYAGSYTNIMGLPSEVVQDWLVAHRYPFPLNPSTAETPA